MLSKLNAIRGFAAIYLVLHHYIYFTDLQVISGSIILLLFRFGQEAVIIFFLLSGFVIHYATYFKKDNFRNYFIKRFRRIYPIFLIAMAVSVIVLWLNGRSLVSEDLRTFVGNLFMLQDNNNKPGNWVEVFGENPALWSLSYEWPFYMLYFPLTAALKSKSTRLLYVFIFSAVCWLIYLLLPNHLTLVGAYFIIWWAGVEAAEIYILKKDFSWSSMKWIMLSLLGMIALTTIPIFLHPASYLSNISPGKYPWIIVRHFIVALGCLILGLAWWRLRLVGFSKTIGLFTGMAPISYAIYVIHLPILWLNIPFVENIYLKLLLKLVIVFILSYLLEQKLQPVFNKLIPTRKS